MKTTYQYHGIDMLKHGQMVNFEYGKLLKELKNNNSYSLLSHLSFEEVQWLLKNQYDTILMRHYHIYHDCGKPFCHEMIDGKNHYPNHAQISKLIHEEYFNLPIANKLIELDMNFHTLKSEELEVWLNKNKLNENLLASLYLTAWSELLANSQLFGGEDTISFKIKKKQLIKAGKKLFSMYQLNKAILNKNYSTCNT